MCQFAIDARQVMKDDLLRSKHTPTELETYLLDLWGMSDASGEGRLPAPHLSSMLRQADLGLSRVQLHSVMGEAGEATDEDGMVDYHRFAPKAAEIVYRLLDLDAQIERMEAIDQIETTARLQALIDIGPENVEMMLLQVRIVPACFIICPLAILTIADSRHASASPGICRIRQLWLGDAIACRPCRRTHDERAAGA